jgi:hypothetical protein
MNVLAASETGKPLQTAKVLAVVAVHCKAVFVGVTVGLVVVRSVIVVLATVVYIEIAVALHATGMSVSVGTLGGLVVDAPFTATPIDTVLACAMTCGAVKL